MQLQSQGWGLAGGEAGHTDLVREARLPQG